MYLHRFCALALLGVVLGDLAADPAQGGFVIRQVKAREILDPIGLYEAELVLIGPPGTFVQGATDPALRDFVTIFDIPDLADDRTKPNGWASDIQPLGWIPDPAPSDLPTDDPDILNITFSYFAGNPIELTDMGHPVAEKVVGLFQWQTFDVDPLVLLSEIHYVWQTSRRLADGSVIKESGVGSAPVQIIGAVPEPSTITMLVSGLVVFAAGAAARRRRKVAPRA